MEISYDNLQAEFEQCLVYLLVKRYNMAYPTVCKIFKVTATQLRSYYSRHRDAVNAALDLENKQAAGLAATAPTLESLKNMSLQRLATTLPGESDPAKLAHTYEILMKASQSGEKTTKKSMSEAIFSGLDAKKERNKKQKAQAKISSDLAIELDDEDDEDEYDDGTE